MAKKSGVQAAPAKGRRLLHQLQRMLIQKLR